MFTSVGAKPLVTFQEDNSKTHQHQNGLLLTVFLFFSPLPFLLKFLAQFVRLNR